MANWRDDLSVHPAADLFPLMSEAELGQLGEDIVANGLQSRIIIYDRQLLDGRNRLDAMALVGIKFKIELSRSRARLIHFEDRHIAWANAPGANDLSGVIDPYAYVVSANIHRRHLTSDQKRELIARLLRAKPGASDRQIAKQTNSSPSTVGAVRKEKEASGDVSKLDTRKDTKGRKQPASKPKAAKPEPKPKPQPEIDPEDMKARLAAADAAANDPKPKPLDFEKVKAKVAELEQQFVDLEIQQCLIRAQQAESVKQANLTPSQAREIKKLSDESDRQLDDILAKHQLGTEEEYYDIAHRVVLEDDDRKRFIKQARNPQKALDDDREREQRGEMECDRNDARQEARQSGESWSEVKDQWEADWILDNWTDEREQEFLKRFKHEWQCNHRQEFPNSDFAPTSKAKFNKARRVT
jgi:hypothetical protein